MSKKLFCDEVLIEDVAGTIVEKLVTRSKEEVEVNINPVEVHEEALHRKYYFEIGLIIDSESFEEGEIREIPE